ncbi:MAG: MerR family transcriptional regulator [Microlunatus sp.]
MRIGELSRLSGVPAPTIKYYLREGLLSPGERTSPNQVRYGDEHVRRLKLVRALIDLGGLSVADARAVLGRIDAPDTDPLDALGKAQYAIARLRALQQVDRGQESAAAEVDALIARHGWRVKDNSPARADLAEVLTTLRRLGHDRLTAQIEPYARAAEQLAAVDVDAVLAYPDADSRAEAVVIGTVLGDAMLAALRRLAQENEATARLSSSR